MFDTLLLAMVVSVVFFMLFAIAIAGGVVRIVNAHERIAAAIERIEKRSQR